MVWLQILVPPLLMLIGGIISWFIKSRTEELKAIEASLTEERRKIYVEILDPMIHIFSDSTDKGKTQAIKKMTSYNYKKTAFELNLFGSDEVVQAFNRLMQHVFKFAEPDKQDPKTLLKLWGGLLLEIRKSLGNKNSNLREIDMLRGMITDIDQYLK